MFSITSKAFSACQKQICQTNNVLRVAKRDNILFDKQISDFFTSNVDRLATALQTEGLSIREGPKEQPLLSLRPWSNDQTLFVKHSKFACKKQCLTVWPHYKNFWSNICFLSKHRMFFKILLKGFCLSSNVLRCGQMIKHCLQSKISVDLPTMFDRLARTLPLLNDTSIASFKCGLNLSVYLHECCKLVVCSWCRFCVYL